MKEALLEVSAASFRFDLFVYHVFLFVNRKNCWSNLGHYSDPRVQSYKIWLAVLASVFFHCTANKETVISKLFIFLKWQSLIPSIFETWLKTWWSNVPLFEDREGVNTSVSVPVPRSLYRFSHPCGPRPYRSPANEEGVAVSVPIQHSLFHLTGLGLSTVSK